MHGETVKFALQPSYNTLHAIYTYIYS